MTPRRAWPGLVAGCLVLALAGCESGLFDVEAPVAGAGPAAPVPSAAVPAPPAQSQTVQTGTAPAPQPVPDTTYAGTSSLLQRVPTAPQGLDPATRAQLEFRRSQIQSQIDTLNRLDAAGRLDPLGHRKELELGGSLDRLNRQLSPIPLPRSPGVPN